MNLLYVSSIYLPFTRFVKLDLFNNRAYQMTQKEITTFGPKFDNQTIEFTTEKSIPIYNMIPNYENCFKY